MKKEIDILRYKQKYRDFLSKRQSLVLSFVDSAGKPFNSTAPFVQKGDKLYVYISKIADHYQLMNSSDYVNVLFLADEAETNNPFATERARFLCTARNLGNEDQEDIFMLFNDKFHSGTMNLLRSLDFSLFELTPLNGRYVVGFGLAFDITIDGTVFQHVVIDKQKDKPSS